MNKPRKMKIRYKYIGGKGTKADKVESERKVAAVYNMLFKKAFEELKKKKSKHL